MAHVFPRLAAGLILFAASFFSLSATAQTPPSAEAFRWEMRDLELSPDGRYLSMIQPYQGRSALVVYPLAGGEPTLIEPGQRGRDENLEVSYHFWSGNDRIIVAVNWNDHYVSRRRNFRLEQTRLLSIRPDGSDPQVLFESRQDRESDISYQSGIIDVLENDDEHILVELRDCGSAVCVATAHKVDINTGRSVIVARGGENTRYFITNSDGEIVGRQDNDDGTYRLYTREPGSVDWTQIMTRRQFEDGVENTLSPIAEVDGYIYLRSDHEGRDGIYRTTTNGGGMETVFLHDRVDAGRLGIDVEDDKITSVTYTVHQPEFVFFDEESEADYNRYNQLLPGEYISVVSETDDETLRVIATYGPGDPTVYYLMNDETNSISEIGQQNPQLSPADLGPVSVVTYQARDGMEISGYLALPPGTTVDDGPFPFVMFPHGGPNARDNLLFDDLRQFLATRGYAVFAPQFRGSRGFGNDFLQAGFEEWGGAMQDDLTDATQFMIDSGIAQSNHMCIVGWSYSAYAALMAAVKTPDLFNCAVGINGVYDLPSLQGNLITSGAWSSLRFWQNTMGENNAELARVSPARRADEIRIPILILASEEDQVAPVGESRRMIQSLRQANRNFESHIYQYGNHSLDYRPNRIDAYERVENFLDQHM